MNQLDNKWLKILSDGGWELIGRVLEEKEDRLILMDEDDDVMLVFKDKIAVLKILKGEPEKKSRMSEHVTFVTGKQKKEDVPSDNDNENDLSDGGISLPYEVLANQNPEFKSRESSDDDFSTFFGGQNKISVTLIEEDDSE